MSYSVFAIGSAASPAVGGNALQVVVAVDGTAAPDMPAPPETDTLGSDQAAPASSCRSACSRSPAWHSWRACACSLFDRPPNGVREPRVIETGPASILTPVPPRSRLDRDAHDADRRPARAVDRRQLLADREHHPPTPVRLVRPACRRSARTDRPPDRSDLRTGSRDGRPPGRSRCPSCSSGGPRATGSVRDELVAAYGADRATAVVADMASLRSVRDAVDRIATNEPRLDVLIDNAGAMFPERTIGRDGLEATLATMVVGPFALIAGLLPLLRHRAGTRSSPSPRAGCTPSRSISTTWHGPTDRGTGHAPTPRQSGPRSR